MKIHIFEDASGEFRWHIRARNGRVVCQGESHPTYGKAKRAVESLVKSIWRLDRTPPIIDHRNPTATKFVK